ncbi:MULTISPECIES: hypothetical protein [unclassified Amycolatopsis]|uniref:hypothetical protein n=1 Tax=unclassified Amycolatopsis TaxID=2618356 RepID=UPI0028755741|nr:MULTISPECIES: hypothetical protein [unclassified Amycolatopsis]MDS0140352.1 hypothetical protein [Amycolatopsis sp. 505]MDS0149044.1 hypothetical protein [Amycolatopsis sp. CM201R]
MSRAGVLGPAVAANYVFRVGGAIPERAAEGVEDFHGVLVVPAPPDTIVFGTVADPESLPAVLRRLEALGMHVHSVHRVRELPVVRRAP